MNIIGCKYYRYDKDDNLELITVIRIKNENCFIVKDKNESVFKITKDDLSTYTKLNPDGYITFAIVGLEGGIRDVIVTLHRNKDVSKYNLLPYCACRQNITNLFYNIVNRDEETMHIGCSVSRDTCPQDVKFEIVIACNTVIESKIVNVYLEDDLDDILALINTLNYDATLRELSNMYDKSKVLGYQFYLKALLLHNNFMADFYSAFGITKVKFAIDPDYSRLSDQQITEVEDLIKYRVINHMLVPFKRDIKLDEIQKDYLLLSDNKGDIYVLAYIKGEYINRPYQNLESHEELEYMVK